MESFSDIMDFGDSIFKNQDIFTLEYVPEIIHCRDEQLKRILLNIKPLLQNNKTINTIIIGNSSTGKTTVLKHAIKEIEEHTDLTTCYINCNIQNSARKCYIQIYRILSGVEAKKNLSTEIIQEEVMKKLEEQSFVLVIDDINNLNKNDANLLINDFFRINEFYHTNIALIITITNELFKYSLEKNAQNILHGQEIHFNDYTEDEIFKILKYRCSLGLKEGVITDRQIAMISNHATATSLREAITLLHVIGKEVELDNRSKIEDEDIRKNMLSTNFKKRINL